MKKESYRCKIYINLGFSFLFLVLMIVSIFINKVEIFEKVFLEFSGLTIGLLLINGLEWLRLENDR